MNASYHIRTDRLLLRQWRNTDLEPYYRICSDPEVMRWIGSGSPQSRQHCEAAVGRIREGWAARGYGLFALEHAGTGAFVGMCGLSVPTFLPEVLPAVEIGWRLGREFWGQGLATEAARAVLRDAFEHHRLDSIISIHQVGNDASANIMRKLGMRFDRATVDPSCNRPVHVHAIARSEYINAMEGTSRA